VWRVCCKDNGVALRRRQPSSESHSFGFLAISNGKPFYGPSLIPKRWKKKYRADIWAALTADPNHRENIDEIPLQSSRWRYFTIDKEATAQCPKGYIVLSDGEAFLVLNRQGAVGLFSSVDLAGG